MTGFEWFLLVVVVIVVPLVVAVAVTLWTLEMARQRKRENRPASDPAAGPVKRKATRAAATPEEELPGIAASDSSAAGAATETAQHETPGPRADVASACEDTDADSPVPGASSSH